MTLLDHTLWWHVYPLGACGAPIRGVDVAAMDQVEHRLGRLEPWLDHLLELGCNGLLLAPIFASSTHGYDTIDHYRIDPRLGDDADFDALLAAARERGIAVMLDGVFNHVGVQHPLVARTLAEGHGPVAVEPGPDGAPRPRPWEGHGDLAELDHDSPEATDLVTDVMLHWLRRGIAGWRLDVAYAVPPRFWAEVTDRVRREFPDAVFLGEVISGDYAAIAREGHLDSITQYELWKAIWSSLAEENMWELDHALGRHVAYCASFLPNTFVGNHDVDRVADKVGDAKTPLAAAILLTVPGMPSIYYGDEEGFTGSKGEGYHADDPLRPPLPATPADMAPFGRWLHEVYRDLIGVRRRNPWLTRGSLEVVAKENGWITYEVRGDGGNGHGTDGHDAHTARVELVVADAPEVTVTIDGERAFHWAAEG